MSVQHLDDRVTLDPRTRVLLLACRQALLIILGALEEYAGLPRSVPRGGERRAIAHQYKEGQR